MKAPTFVFPALYGFTLNYAKAQEIRKATKIAGKGRDINEVGMMNIQMHTRFWFSGVNLPEKEVLAENLETLLNEDDGKFNRPKPTTGCFKKENEFASLGKNNIDKRFLCVVSINSLTFYFHF